MHNNKLPENHPLSNAKVSVGRELILDKNGRVNLVKKIKDHAAKR